jgi:hypothetical protein
MGQGGFLMTAPVNIVVSQRTVKALITVQSILAGAQTLVAAGALADVIGVTYAALAVAVVAAVQQGVSAFMARVVGQAVGHAAAAETRAAEVIDNAAHVVADAATASTHGESGAPKPDDPWTRSP